MWPGVLLALLAAGAALPAAVPPATVPPATVPPVPGQQVPVRVEEVTAEPDPYTDHWESSTDSEMPTEVGEESEVPISEGGEPELENDVPIPEGGMPIPEGMMPIPEGMMPIPEGVMPIPEGVMAAPEGAPQCPAPPPACEFVGGANNEYEYKVDNMSLVVAYRHGEQLSLRCGAGGARALDAAALPALPGAGLSVRALLLAACAVPRASLAGVLRALRVSLHEPAHLRLLRPPPEPALGARHLAGLLLARLTVECTAAAPCRLQPGTLAALARLERLELLHATPAAGELDALPAALRDLSLRGVELRRPPPSWARAPLERLSLSVSGSLDARGAPAAARHLELLSASTEFEPMNAAAAETLTLGGWSERRPAPLTACAALMSLTLISPAMEALPAGWVSRCARLRSLAVHGAARLLALPTGLLEGAGGLRALRLATGALTSLPQDFLRPANRLEELVLSDNHLTELSSGLLSGGHVQRLDLSGNSLRSAALHQLGALGSLRRLMLDRNRALGDLCSSVQDASPLRDAAALEHLSLRHTAVTMPCRDWRHAPSLRVLDLRDTNITEIWVEDLRFVRSKKGAKVRLQGAPVRVVRAAEPAGERAREPSGELALVELDAALECDCRMYWTRRRLAELAHVSGLRCAGAEPRALREVRAEDMVCAADAECAADAALPVACRCDVRPAAAPAAAWLRVHCEGAGLRRVPRVAPRSPLRRYELLLAHNDIASLDAADLPDSVESIDLSNNSLSVVSGAAARRLGELAGPVLLGGNPLDCSCRNAALLRALQRRYRRAPGAELAGLACRGGEELARAPAADCAPPAAALGTWLLAGVAALAAVALLALALLASRERRFFLKAVLARWGCLWREAEPKEAERPYDAFLTFAHEDEAVALAMVARLEPRYRLCVHYRDWTPGRLIADQVAESVERSRRTVALVSRHFLASAWARAEFRSAHGAALRDGRPRLVVVLLEEPAALAPDPRLRRYLASNTYVRWGDPWFWDKMRVALPPPRDPLPPAAAATPAPGTEPAQTSPTPPLAISEDVPPAPAAALPAPAETAAVPPSAGNVRYSASSEHSDSSGVSEEEEYRERAGVSEVEECRERAGWATEGSAPHPPPLRELDSGIVV